MSRRNNRRGSDGESTSPVRDLLIADNLEGDENIVEDDILGSQAHVVMLANCGIIGEEEGGRILAALRKAREHYAAGEFILDPAHEDVHLNVEAFVTRETGVEVGGKLHTARSRNDQVILDLRLYLRRELNVFSGLVLKLEEALIRLGEGHLETVMPGYTHLQHAQPITLAHWASAYGEMLLRDCQRLEEAYRRIDSNPLGACALAGTSWPIDRQLTASLLGFSKVEPNSLDVVTSRGEEVVEVTWDLALLMTHLSRLCEDLILWSTTEFGMVKMGEAYTTGSSIMPQKRNPDAAELIRAKASVLIGELVKNLALVKGLPSGYFKDTQELKLSLFKSVATAKLCLQVAEGLITSLKVERERMAELAGRGYSTATDLADLLARRGVPFRSAHKIVAQLVVDLEKEGREMGEVSPEDLSRAMKKYAGKVSISALDILKATDPLQSVKAKKSLGSPSPKLVRSELERLKKKTREMAVSLRRKVRKIDEAYERLEKRVGELIEKGDELGLFS